MAGDANYDRPVVQQENYYGGNFVIVDFSFVNNSKKSISLDPVELTLIDSKHRKRNLMRILSATYHQAKTSSTSK